MTDSANRVAFQSSLNDKIQNYSFILEFICSFFCIIFALVSNLIGVIVFALLIIIIAFLTKEAHNTKIQNQIKITSQWRKLYILCKLLPSKLNIFISYTLTCVVIYALVYFGVEIYDNTSQDTNIETKIEKLTNIYLNIMKMILDKDANTYLYILVSFVLFVISLSLCFGFFTLFQYLTSFIIS